MKTSTQLVLAALVASILAGCASVGQNFDESKISQIKKGETTEADLIQMLGQPQSRTLNSEGQSILTWTYTESKVKGESFIPYAGPFMGGTRSATKTLNVTLQDGKVVSFASTGGGMESRGTTQSVPKESSAQKK